MGKQDNITQTHNIKGDVQKGKPEKAQKGETAQKKHGCSEVAEYG